MDESNVILRFIRFIVGGISPELTLLENWLFRLAVVTPIALAAHLALSNGLLDLSAAQLNLYEALSNIWANEKLIPIIAGLSFPFGAIAASHLRSLQASTQIKQQKEQNIFINHFKHLEEFSKALEKTDLKTKYNIRKSSNELHSIIFPHSTDGDYIIQPELKTRLRMCLLAIIKFCESCRKNGATNSDIEAASKQCKDIITIALASHSMHLDSIPVNKYDYAQTLCIRYKNLVAEVCEAASFYSRHSMLGILTKATETEKEIKSALGRYVNDEKKVLAVLQRQTVMLEQALSNNSLDSKSAFNIHTAIKQKIESENLDPKLYYPYERLIDAYPYLNTKVIEYIQSTAPREIIDLLSSKAHPQ